MAGIAAVRARLETMLSKVPNENKSIWSDPEVDANCVMGLYDYLKVAVPPQFCKDEEMVITNDKREMTDTLILYSVRSGDRFLDEISDELYQEYYRMMPDVGGGNTGGVFDYKGVGGDYYYDKGTLHIKSGTYRIVHLVKPADMNNLGLDERGVASAAHYAASYMPLVFSQPVALEMKQQAARIASSEYAENNGNAFPRMPAQNLGRPYSGGAPRHILEV